MALRNVDERSKVMPEVAAVMSWPEATVTVVMVVAGLVFMVFMVSQM